MLQSSGEQQAAPKGLLVSKGNSAETAETRIFLLLIVSQFRAIFFHPCPSPPLQDLGLLFKELAITIRYKVFCQDV